MSDIYKSSGGEASIPQYSSDPVSPSPEDAWVLKSGGGGAAGTIRAFFGLGWPYLGTGASLTYQFSYRTLEGTTKRVTISWA